MSRLQGVIIIVGLVLASCTPEGTDKERGESADLILAGATIYTANQNQKWAEAVAIRDGRFVYVGDSTGAEAFRSADTRVLDLGGRFVVPGLIDSHAHPGYINVEVYGEISETNEAEMLAAVRNYAEEHPDQEWLRLCCWPIDLYVAGNEGPHKETLDAVVADRPVWFVSESWHSGWLNSQALETLGVGIDTEDPKHGVATYSRDEYGVPTGWIKEGAAWQHFARHFPIDDPVHQEFHKESIVTALRQLSESGITTLYDAGNFGFEDQVYGFLAQLEREGRLPVRYEGTYQVFTPERRHHAISEIERYRSAYGGQRLKFNTVKLFMDGIYQNRTAAISDPYLDDTSSVSDTLLSVEELRDFLLELSESRLDIHVHAEGDMAVRRVLDAVEHAKGVTGDGFYTRVTLSHLGLIDAADLPRFRKLGIVANYTPWWFTTEADDPERASLGGERFERMFDPKSLIGLGVTVTLSSDEWWGGDALPTYLNPYFGMQVGHTRMYPSEWRDLEEFPKPPEAGQMTIEEVILGYTQSGAYQLRMEDEIGSIEVGKLADLIVLNENLFGVDSDTIWKTKPVAVLMEGTVVQGTLPDER